MYCKFCKLTQNLHKDGRTKGGKQRYVCNECNTRRLKKYRQTESGKLRTRLAIKNYETTHPERRNAWNKAIKLENKPCIKCGDKAHKHHPDPLRPLEIIYLCPLHHKQEHML